MERVTVAAAADVSTGHEPPESAFTHVLDILRKADIRFAQVERLYSGRGSLQQQSGSKHGRQDPRYAAAFKSVPFDVLSVASNHTGDWGPEAAEDTVDVFRKLGIATIGAGSNIVEARKPAILTRNGVRIAFLGYVSTVPPQAWATDTRAGGAPMRAHTFYEPYEFQPGAPARVVTVAHEQDLKDLVQDVRAAKRNADVVFVSLHWGVHYVSKPSAYQTVVAHAAIDAGASIILGHHAHQPQGIEVYKDGVVFYSIGNFSFPPRTRGHSYCAPNREFLQKDVYLLEPDPGFYFDYMRHFNEGGVVHAEVDKVGLVRVSYLPTLVNADGQPKPLQPDEEQFQKSLTYLNWAGKFVAGGVTNLEAVGDRYEVYKRKS